MDIKSNKIRAIITGVTGMVGEGVLHECLHSDAVEAVLIINRKSSGISHPKLKEIVHSEFFNLMPIEGQLIGYNACYFCLGVSSIGMKEPDYEKVTYDLTLHVAATLVKLNPEMTFCYVSGAGTDSSENGSSMWARVKGKTENALMKLPFKQVFAFRPGYIHPTPGLKNVLPFVKYVSWLYPLFKIILPNTVSTLGQVGQAMIKATQFGYDKKVLEVKDIKNIADRQYV
ncbi:epimerase [Dyadobacter sp. CY326]|uniref:epimerase n=1 Tax=Dyadobacter sp. CY326 TaxID=2907300 RepID=UPI001F2B1619|nr:epimerase [Dyadobacter sp. CY326]MCE7064695.1 epimerase [Dyadobacter sp. CY326]